MPDPFADLVFRETHRYRPFEVVSPPFAEPAVADSSGPATPYAALELDLGAVGSEVRIGLVSDDGGSVVATYDAARRHLRLDVTGANGQVKRRRRRRVRIEDGSILGFALCENQVTVLARAPGARWKPLITERDRLRLFVDLRAPDVLARHRWTWSGDDVRDARHGPFGMTGLRDPHLVTNADGSAYERDGRVYLTWTCAGLGGFRQAHWGVFALDPADPEGMEQVAHVISRRDGRLHGDHAGQLVRDGDAWLVAVSTWGDFSPTRGVHVRHTRTDADLLSGVHVVDTRPLRLPTRMSSWDPALVRRGDGWLVAYVESPSVKPFRFHPALAAGPLDDLRPVGAVTDLEQCEGPVLVEREGRTWLLGSDGRGHRFPVFDQSLTPAGHLSAPYPTNIPHPQLLRRDDGSWLMLTFDGTRNEPRRRETGRRPVMGYGGHGDVVVMTAQEDPR